MVKVTKIRMSKTMQEVVNQKCDRMIASMKVNKEAKRKHDKRRSDPEHDG